MDMPYTLGAELLQKAGIYKFAAEMSALANRVLAEQDGTDPLLEYIWKGGVYGSTKNKLSIQKMRMGGVAGYTKHRLFPRLKTLEGYYPILKKMPILLPVIWIYRGIKAVFRGRTRVLVSEISRTQEIREDSVSEVQAICARLEL